ncbi:MAG TPA: N(4)-(beta-N-acetylglucosaminyl)-L-asparaginase, partial [Chthonomonadales bacterium]|nr:N(4)-(beta-N-acetylglucosaminyl)-L-asparaginase [Chthonomonadales bacterium]
MITSWPFGLPACRTGWSVLAAGGSALDAVEQAANVTEEDPEASSVGYGGMPNAEGVVELDAAIMDGALHRAGAVGGLSGIRRPISVARKVMETTHHVFLVGYNARRFAIRNDFPEHDLTTEFSRSRYREWRLAHSAPEVAHFHDQAAVDEDHDTIGLCALDGDGNVAAGCTTSGLAWKTPGRVGDSPIIGSGLYADNEVGCAAATGDGDEMMKACLSYRIVMLMELGATPQHACEEALRYLLRKR